MLPRLQPEEYSHSDVRRGVRLPREMTPELAELLGILMGDGCIAAYKGNGSSVFMISVSGNALHDHEYCRYVSELFYTLFNIIPRAYKAKNQNTIVLAVRSKALFHFFKSIDMNIGPKKDLHIPHTIPEEKAFHIPFIRGLFDTDGSLALKKYNHDYPVISLKLNSRYIIEQVEYILRNLGFSMYVEYDTATYDARGFTSVGSRIYIYGRKNLRKWVDLIGFHNRRHTKKIERGMGRVGISPTVREGPCALNS